MSLSTVLSSAFILASCIRPTIGQQPANLPACVTTCAEVKAREGYCNTPVFATAYEQCLRDNCDAAGQATGNQFTNTICSIVSPGSGTGTGNTTQPAPGVTPAPGVVPGPPPTNVTTGGNSTTNSTLGNGTEYGTTLSRALQAAGLGTFATVLASPAAAPVVARLQQGNHTVFAPSDAALAPVSLNSTSPADLDALINYHILPGTLDLSKLPSNGHAIVRTSLRGAPYVNLPANDSQVLVLSQQNGSLTIIEPTKNITVPNPTPVGNLQLSSIQGLLTIPGTIAAVAASVPQLSNLVAAVNSSVPQLFGELDQTPGLTIFAPINSALTNLTTTPAFQATLLNHVVNETVLYSTTIANTGNHTSAGGAPISFTTNSSGTFAHSADRTLKIVQADILTRNGVIHLVDGLFEPSNSTPVFPIPNSNNATETVGLTPLVGDATNPRQAASSPALRTLPCLGALTAVVGATLYTLL